MNGFLRKLTSKEGENQNKKKIEIIKGFYNINLIMSPSEIIPTNLPFSTTGN